MTYTANDGKGGVTSTTFTLTVKANSAPVAPSIGNKSGEKGVAWPATTLPAFTDADSDALTYTVTGLPPGLAFTASTRKLSGTPTTAGTYTVTYSANDGHGGATSTSFSITINAVVNNAPYQNKVIPTVNVNYGGSVNYVLAADVFLDPEGGALTYSATGMPSWLSFAPATKLFSGTPPQTIGTRTYTIGVTATDTGGLSASTTFTISVKGSGAGGGGVIQVAPGDSSDLDVEEQQFVEGGEPENLDGVQAEPMASPVALAQDAWYAYDKLNRVAVSNGMLSGGQVVLKQGDNSYSVSYDAVGNAVAQQRWLTEGGSSNFVLKTTQQAYSLRGQVTLSLGNGTTTRYVYDQAGRLTERTSYFATGTKRTWIDAEGNVVPVNVGGMVASHETSTYDDDGRLLTQVSRGRNETLVERTPVGYPANPKQQLPAWVGQAYDWIVSGQGANPYDAASLTEVSTVSYTGGNLGYDAAGRVKGYTYQSDASGTANDYTHTYTYAYEGRDSYLEKTVTGTSNKTAYKITTSTMTYDAAGRQTEIREHTEGASLDDRVRTFALDGNGMILGRRDGTLDGSTFEQNQTDTALLRLNQHYVYANGQQVAGLDEAGKVDALSRLTAFSSSEAGRAQVVVQAGETLRNLAQRVYGSADLWYVIAGANGLAGDADLVAGTSLTVPEVRTSSNDAGTFKPYNPGEITGPTSPGLPYIPAPDKGCGTLGIVIMVAVIIVVSVYTAGAASGAASAASGAAGGAGAATGGAAAGAAAGGAAAGAGASTSVWSAGLAAFSGGGGVMSASTAVMSAGAGALAGSAVGQGAGSLMGVASFSWRNALVSGASSMATAGMGALIQGGQLGQLGEMLNETTWARAAAQATVSNLTSYGASRVVGADASFSWRSVAASAVSAAVSTKLGEALNLSPTPDMGGSGSFWKDVGNGMLGGVTSLHTRRVLGFDDDINYRNIAADAFGNALGNAAVRGLESYADRQYFEENATDYERSLFDQAVDQGANRRDLLSAYRSDSFRGFLAANEMAGQNAQGRYGKSFDQLSEDEQANIWDSIYRYGEVGDPESLSSDGELGRRVAADTVGILATGQQDTAATDQLSARQRIGRGVANLITDGTESLESVINWIGPERAKSAAILASMAAGGPLKSAGQFLFDQVVGSQLDAVKEAYFYQPVSELSATYVFGATSPEEQLAVKPASDALSHVGGNFLMVGFGLQAANRGADSIVQNSMGFTLRKQKAEIDLGNLKYKVGSYRELKRETPGTGLDAHHAGQKKVMERLVSNYDERTAPAIAVPRKGHTQLDDHGQRVSTSPINPNTGMPFDNARQVVARDIRELRRVYGDDIPREQLRLLIGKNKQMYPEVRIKPGD